MAPTKSTLVKWTQEEVDVLVEMTNHQLELEAQDKSMLISWTTHWKKVSQRLKELGHIRTPTACRGIWRRGVQEQQAQRDAAGDDWDESEHEILVHMTKKQLDLEKGSQTNVVPWAKHWKKVSLQLDESGYSRTPDNCAAFWSLVENDVVGDASGLGGDDDDVLDVADDALSGDVEEEAQTLEANAEVDEEIEVAQPSDLTVSSPQASKLGVWGVEEFESLLGLLKAHRQREADEGLEMLTGSRLWIEITKSHRESGFDRSWEGCKTFWNKQGRERSGFDERVKLSPRPSNHSAMQPIAESSSNNPSTRASEAKPSSDQSRPSRPSSLWSTVNEADAEEATVVSRNPAIDALKKFQKDRPVETHVSPSTEAQRPKSPEPVLLEVDLNQEQIQAQKKRGTSLNSSTPTQSGASEKSSSAVKYGLTSFRFTPEQRAVLEAEAHRTGGTLDGFRKTELAIELGVEEKTVRNWFNNYNVKARRSQGSTPAGYAPTPTPDDIHESRNHTSAATPTPSSQGFSSVNAGVPKRPYVEDGSPDRSHPSKRAQLEPQVETFHVTGGFNPVNGHTSRHTSHDYAAVAPTRQPDSRQSSVRVEHMDTRPDANPSPQADRLPSGTSTTPLDVRNGDKSTTIPKTGPEVPLPPSHLQLKSTPQPNPNPGSQQTPINLPHQHPPVLAPHPPSPAYPNVLRDDENMQTSRNLPNVAQPTSHMVTGRYGEPRLERNTPEPPISVPSAPPQASPNQQWARQPPTLQQEHVCRAPPTSFTAPAPTQDTYARSRTTSTPSDEHPRVQALRHMETFRTEIQALNQANALRTARVATLSQELSVCASRRADINAAREAEIARALRDIEAHYGSMQVGLREHEERLEQEKGIEVEGLNKTAAELSRKEKGFARWQGIVEYYETEGGEEL